MANLRLVSLTLQLDNELVHINGFTQITNGIPLRVFDFHFATSVPDDLIHKLASGRVRPIINFTEVEDV